MVTTSSESLPCQGFHRYIILFFLLLISISVCMLSISEPQDSAPSLNMRFHAATLALLPGLARAVKIVQANDDGWAELYVRSFNQALNAAGYDVILSCPAENKSGTSTSSLLTIAMPAHSHSPGSLDLEPTNRDQPCPYNSCPANSGKTGTDPSNPRLHWVNSFPVTAMRFGLDTFGPETWNGATADLAVSGPNVGSNLFLSVPFSGTVGAAAYAAHEKRIPAIAFSGASEGNLAFDTTPVPARSLVYAELATYLVDEVVKAGTPYLPANVYLNVNFPEVEGSCQAASDFSWVLTRVNPGLFSARDADFCGDHRLPTEESVVNGGGCHISVSVGDATDKTTASREKQEAVIAKIGHIFTCL